MIKDLKLRNNLPVVKAAMADGGFTLVELLIVISILGIMAAILVGTLNPIALVNKAKDSRRKNDLNKIKIAFEAYHTNKQQYPPRDQIKDWNKTENCGKEIVQMKSYLKTLPCDPNKKPYEIVYVNRNTFKVITNLENKKDNHIPPNWYLEDTYLAYATRKNEVNYGVSSSNILWYESVGEIDNVCGHDCIKYVSGSSETITNGSCISGGVIFCFWGQPTGNNFGVAIGSLPSYPQCFTDYCCNGSGCE